MGFDSDYQEMSSDDTSNESYTSTFDNELQTSPLDLSKTSKKFRFIPRSMSIDEASSPSSNLSVETSHTDNRPIAINQPYDEPLVLTEPKCEWHYRSLKDLAKKHIPLISGDGPQRTPIRVKVPQMSTQQMYLGIAVVTCDNEYHDSKVIVPAKTKVNMELLSHDNNLDCLLFDECNPTDYFHPVTRHIYLPINPKEHNAQLKEIRIHMFNLYQNQTITKELIEAKRLDLSRLAFWLCFKDNERYIQISPPSFSCIIQEKKMINRPSISQRMNNQVNVSIPYLMQYMEYLNQDDNKSHILSCPIFPTTKLF